MLRAGMIVAETIGMGHIVLRLAIQGMSEIRKADPVARRNSILVALVGLIAGIAGIGAFNYYRAAIEAWVVSEPGKFAARARLSLLLPAAALSIPLIVAAVQMWTLGSKTLRAGEYPPPGYPVSRDTAVVRDRAAIRRGRGLQAAALFLGFAFVAMWLLISRLVSMLGR